MLLTGHRMGSRPKRFVRITTQLHHSNNNNDIIMISEIGV